MSRFHSRLRIGNDKPKTDKVKKIALTSLQRVILLRVITALKSYFMGKKMNYCIFILSIFLISSFSSVSTSAKSREELNQLLLKEMNDWLNDYDESGHLRVVIFKPDELVERNIKRSGHKENTALFYKNFDEIIKNKKWLDEDVLRFRQEQTTFSQTYNKDQFESRQNHTQKVNSFITRIKKKYERSYESMSRYGRNILNIQGKDKK